MARKKGAALEVPANAREAALLLVDYVGDDRAIMKIELTYQTHIDALKAERDRLVATIAEIQTGRFASLKAWWEAGGSTLAGKARSADLAGAKLGIRLTPPAVKFARGVKAAAIIAWLRLSRWRRGSEFLRVKVELDKPAMLKAIQAEEDIRLKFGVKGVTVDQVDEFFIDTGLDEEAIRKEVSAS